MKAKLYTAAAKAWEILILIYRILTGLFLICLAVALVTVLTPFAFAWKLWASFTEEGRKGREIASGTVTYFVAIASSVDKFGNCAFSGLLNAFLLRKGHYKFGNNYETISEVLGWAERYNDLTKTGEALVLVLDWIDPDHARKSMIYGVERARMKTELFNQLNPPQ